jgi:small subunit ribosomal protein S17
MAAKSKFSGVVVGDKMDKTVVVAVERQVRHGLYGKTQRRTTKLLAHNDGNTARAGDLVEIVQSRPLSRRKRWVVTRIVRRAVGPRADEVIAPGETPSGAQGQA